MVSEYRCPSISEWLSPLDSSEIRCVEPEGHEDGHRGTLLGYNNHVKTVRWDSSRIEVSEDSPDRWEKVGA